MVQLFFPGCGTWIWSLSPFGPLIWLIRWAGLLQGPDGIRLCVCVFMYVCAFFLYLHHNFVIIAPSTSEDVSFSFPNITELPKLLLRTILYCMYSFLFLFWDTCYTQFFCELYYLDTIFTEHSYTIKVWIFLTGYIRECVSQWRDTVI